MGTPKVSIIVPVYNSELYLDRCIASTLGQTYESFELILVDDGSTDNSMDICKKVQANDNRIKIIDCGKHNGVSYARNQGLDSAEGEYIFFLDSDDCLHPQMLEVTVKQAELSGSDMCMTGHMNTDKAKKSFDEYCHDVLSPEWLVCNGDDIWAQWFKYKTRNPVWAKLFRKSSIGELRFCGDVAEDTIFNYQFLSDSNRRVSFTEIPSYCYFPRKDSVSHHISFDRFKDWIHVFDILQKNEANRGYWNNAIKLQCENIHNIGFWLTDVKSDKKTRLMAKELLIAEKEHKWFKDIPTLYKFRVIFICILMPLNHFLVRTKRMIKDFKYQYTSRQFKTQVNR